MPSIGEPETGKPLQHDLSENIQRPPSDVRRDTTDKQMSILCSGSLAVNRVLHFLAATGVLVFSVWLYIYIVQERLVHSKHLLSGMNMMDLLLFLLKKQVC